MLGSLGTILLVSAVGLSHSNPNGYYYLEAGGYVAGQVLADDGDNVSIRLRATDEVRNFAYADFTNRTQYKMRSYTIDPESGSDQLMMGNYALHLGLYQEATRNFRRAVRLTPNLWTASNEGLKRVRFASGVSQLDKAASQLETGRLNEAQQALIELSKHSDEEIAYRAVALIDSIPDVTRSKPYFVEQDFPSFARVRKYLERAKERNRDGLLHTSSSSRAQRDFRSASKDIRRALILLKKIGDKQGHEGPFESAFLEMNRELLELQTATVLNQCSLYVVQQSFRQALVVLNGALAYDQTNARLLDARARVEEAVSNASAVVLSSL
ncbi:MAG: hypothetical protein CMJ89_08640 [Planctomycetes bacterium]|jgi:tetratricopeptide (TPR) repeat protein|nr:hypothetical protein [Planctomycetota bacterium]